MIFYDISILLFSFLELNSEPVNTDCLCVRSGFIIWRRIFVIGQFLSLCLSSYWTTLIVDTAVTTWKTGELHMKHYHNWMDILWLECFRTEFHNNHPNVFLTNECSFNSSTNYIIYNDVTFTMRRNILY